MWPPRTVAFYLHDALNPALEKGAKVGVFSDPE